MVMRFVLYPLSHYDLIIESCARFLLSLLEGLTIAFPSHFILFLINVYKDTATRDKLIFSFAIMRILLHSSVSYPESPHFFIMCAISMATIRRSKAQLQPKQPQTKTTTPPPPFTPSTSTPSSSSGGVMLATIMAQLERIDTRFNTFNDELCQVHTRVGHIAQRQACMGGFVGAPSPSPSLEASKDKDNDDGSGSNDDANADKDASSSSDDEMTASQ